MRQLAVSLAIVFSLAGRKILTRAVRFDFARLCAYFSSPPPA
jgi:hypothetical protein